MPDLTVAGFYDAYVLLAETLRSLRSLASELSHAQRPSLASFQHDLVYFDQRLHLTVDRLGVIKEAIAELERQVSALHNVRLGWDERLGELLPPNLRPDWMKPRPVPELDPGPGHGK